MNNIKMTAKGMVINSVALIVGVVASTPTTPSGLSGFSPFLGRERSKGFLAGKFKYLDC
ncbi:MAG: hypothetical protein NXH75_00330 [Halobacteriovoraceae bacterium]|nr:hypothetical protein [Halobacteriovoraceae bacterium]